MAQLDANTNSGSVEELLAEAVYILRQNQRTLLSMDDKLRKLTVILSNR